ncbi:MAG: tetratricopeptide repeat protein [Candidatus Obscuribacterales bacterium]|nr:tetratricopeptide repeat protein [Candidatus Obscuribacterales bacterium]
MLNPVSRTLIAIALMLSSSTPLAASVIPKASERECKRLLGRGDQLFSGGAFHGSLSFYQQAVTAEPSSWEAHLKYGRTLSRLARTEEALSELFQSVMLNADNPETNLTARAEIAAIFMKQGNYDEAGGQLKQVLDLSPNDNVVRGNYAICLEHLGFIDAAIEQFRLIAKANTYDTVVLYNLGAAYLRKADFQTACRYFERVISIDNKNVLSYLGLANAMLLTGNVEKSIEYCKVAVKLVPNNHLAHLALGDAYEKSGDRAKAVDSYRTAIQINPRDRSSRAALAKILESSRQVSNKGQLQLTQ